MARVVFVYGFALSFFLFHAFADAVLVRGGGRGTHSDSSITIYTLVDDRFTNNLGLDPDYIPIEEELFNSGLDELLSTPADCEAIFFDAEDLQNARDFEGFVDEPCYYEVYENDLLLEFNGYGRALFDLAFSANITWSLTRDGFPPVIINNDINAIVDSEVLLSTLMPEELVPGEYLIDLDVVFHSGPNSTFYRAIGDITEDIGCDEILPGELECYLLEFSGSDTISFSSEYRERLVVLPGSRPINEPFLLSLFLIGLFAVYRHKK